MGKAVFGIFSLDFMPVDSPLDVHTIKEWNRIISLIS
nr:MAG TPA: outer membrane lipoprotein [Caudoviricetes sp.]